MPLSSEEQAMLDAVPDEPATLKAAFGIAEPEHPGLSLQAALQRPSTARTRTSASVTFPAASSRWRPCCGCDRCGCDAPGRERVGQHLFRREVIAQELQEHAHLR